MIDKFVLRMLTFLTSWFGWLQVYLLNNFFHAKCKQFWTENLNKMDIHVNGDRPWDIQIHHEDVYTRALDGLGMGETYMEGLWDCADLAGLFSRALEKRSEIMKLCQTPIGRFKNFVEISLLNLQTKERAKHNIKAHYDLGNDLFQAMLDFSMTYSCAYWKTADNLESAQFDKMTLIAQKLNLLPGMTILEIGCGWGGLAQHLAQHYGVTVTSITISKEQAVYAEKRCAGLPVKIKLQDYRDVTGTFDRVVSIACLEHIGSRNYDTFFTTVHSRLADDGLFLLHSGGINHYGLPQAGPWISKYIFPGGHMPYYKEITDAMENRFIIEDWQNIGADYAKTLAAWYMNFNRNWSKLRPKYGDKFGRMWTYYLEMCNGLFEARLIQVWQIVLSKNGVKGGYYGGR